MFVRPTRPFFGAADGLTLDIADAVLFGAPHGVPYPDHDPSACAGAPSALRDAFDPTDGVEHWDFDLDGPFLNDGPFKFMDAGDLATIAGDGSNNRRLIREATAAIVGAGAVPIMMGGDDSTPIPFLEALAPTGPITIVQVDAHIDWREERYGERHGFSSTMLRASEMAHVERIVQIGMRGVGSARRGEVETAVNWGARIVPASRLHAEGVAAALAEIPEGAACAITIDCDALDPGIMPAVLAPTPGGLTYTQLIGLIAGVVAKARLVACDVIEFVPARDPDGAAAYTAARLICQAVGRLARA